MKQYILQAIVKLIESLLIGIFVTISIWLVLYFLTTNTVPMPKFLFQM